MCISGEEAVKLIKSGDRLFIHGGAATRHYLLRKITERAFVLFDINLSTLNS
jgi:acyl-CoA hydrolase